MYEKRFKAKRLRLRGAGFRGLGFKKMIQTVAGSSMHHKVTLNGDSEPLNPCRPTWDGELKNVR